MKKQIMFLLIGVSLLVFGTVSFAETFEVVPYALVRTIEGIVVSVNASKNVAVIKDRDSMNYFTVLVYPDQIGSLQVGQHRQAVAQIWHPFYLK